MNSETAPSREKQVTEQINELRIQIEHLEGVIELLEGSLGRVLQVASNPIAEEDKDPGLVIVAYDIFVQIEQVKKLSRQVKDISERLEI